MNNSLPGASMPLHQRKEFLAEMPMALQDQLGEIETWSNENYRDARSDAVRYWALKIPAILVAACASVFAFFRLSTISVIASAISSFCVLFDGLNPGGLLRNTHHKAFIELRKLHHDIRSQWRIESYKVENDRQANELASKIVKNAQKEITRISTYLKDAETALGGRKE